MASWRETDRIRELRHSRAPSAAPWSNYHAVLNLKFILPGAQAYYSNAALLPHCTPLFLVKLAGQKTPKKINVKRGWSLLTTQLFGDLNYVTSPLLALSQNTCWRQAFITQRICDCRYLQFYMILSSDARKQRESSFLRTPISTAHTSTSLSCYDYDLDLGWWLTTDRLWSQ